MASFASYLNACRRGEIEEMVLKFTFGPTLTMSVRERLGQFARMGWVFEEFEYHGQGDVTPFLYCVDEIFCERQVMNVFGYVSGEFFFPCDVAKKMQWRRGMANAQLEFFEAGCQAEWFARKEEIRQERDIEDAMRASMDLTAIPRDSQGRVHEPYLFPLDSAIPGEEPEVILALNSLIPVKVIFPWNEKLQYEDMVVPKDGIPSLVFRLKNEFRSCLVCATTRDGLKELLQSYPSGRWGYIVGEASEVRTASFVFKSFGPHDVILVDLAGKGLHSPAMDLTVLLDIDHPLHRLVLTGFMQVATINAGTEVRRICEIVQKGSVELFHLSNMLSRAPRNVKEIIESFPNIFVLTPSFDVKTGKRKAKRAIREVLKDWVSFAPELTEERLASILQSPELSHEICVDVYDVGTNTTHYLKTREDLKSLRVGVLICDSLAAAFVGNKREIYDLKLPGIGMHFSRELVRLLGGEGDLRFFLQKFRTSRVESLFLSRSRTLCVKYNSKVSGKFGHMSLGNDWSQNAIRGCRQKYEMAPKEYGLRSVFFCAKARREIYRGNQELMRVVMCQLSQVPVQLSSTYLAALFSLEGDELSQVIQNVCFQFAVKMEGTAIEQVETIELSDFRNVLVKYCYLNGRVMPEVRCPKSFESLWKVFVVTQARQVDVLEQLFGFMKKKKGVGSESEVQLAKVEDGSSSSTSTTTTAVPLSEEVEMFGEDADHKYY